jgi:hypothetical protein
LSGSAAVSPERKHMTSPEITMVSTPDLQEGDQLVDTMGLVVAGPPGTDVSEDGYVLVPLRGSDEPIRFLVTASWRVLRP